MLGVLVGFALPAGGCSDPCPEYEAEGNYRIDAKDYRSDWVEDSARVEITEATILIFYATTDGSRWEVEFGRGATHN